MENRSARKGEGEREGSTQVRSFVYPTGDNRRGETQGRGSPEDRNSARDCVIQRPLLVSHGEGGSGVSGGRWSPMVVGGRGSRGSGLLNYRARMRRYSGTVTMLGLQVDGAWVMLQAMIKGLCCYADVATKGM